METSVESNFDCFTGFPIVQVCECGKHSPQKKKNKNGRKLLWPPLFLTVKTVETGMKNQQLPGDMDFVWKTEWRDSWFQPLKDDLGSWSLPALDCVAARCFCLELPLSTKQEKSHFLLFTQQHIRKNGRPCCDPLVIQHSYLTVWISLLKGISGCSKPPSLGFICYRGYRTAAEAPQLRFHKYAAVHGNQTQSCTETGAIAASVASLHLLERHPKQPDFPRRGKTRLSVNLLYITEHHRAQ